MAKIEIAEEMKSRMSNHGHLLHRKFEDSDDAGITVAFKAYLEYRESISKLQILTDESVRQLVGALNLYREKAVYLFEARANSGQEGFRSSILEELFVDLFRDLVGSLINVSPARVLMGKGNSYVSLSFTPYSFKALFESPKPSVHTKDQDFVLGCIAQISVSPVEGSEREIETVKVVIPVLAIECKTYLERNMLDSCAGTARRVKEAMPYCLYIVASEYLKMESAYPELTHIDEVFILCKALNSEREDYKRKGLAPHPIDADLVVEFFNMVKTHFNKIWWDPANALTRGRIIGRP